MGEARPFKCLGNGPCDESIDLSRDPGIAALLAGAFSASGAAGPILNLVVDIGKRYARRLIANAVLSSLGHWYIHAMTRIIREFIEAPARERGKSPEQLAEEIIDRFLAAQAYLAEAGYLATLWIGTWDYWLAFATSKLLEVPYWHLGLGFLGWQIVAPSLSQCVLRVLESKYAEICPTRGAPRSVVEAALAARAAVSSTEAVLPELVRYYRSEGYSDQAVKLMVEAWLQRVERERRRLQAEAERRAREPVRGLTEAEVRRALEYGLLDDTRVSELLARLGHGKEAVELERRIWAEDIRREYEVPRLSEMRRYLVQTLALESEDVALRIIREWLESVGIRGWRAQVLAAIWLADIRRERKRIERELRRELKERYRGLSESDIRYLYLRGMIEDDQAREYLKYLGYAPEAIDLLLMRWKHERCVRLAELRARLGGKLLEGVGQECRDDVFLQLKLLILESRRQRVPPLSILRRWYLQGLIDEDGLRERLRLLGYRPEDIEIIVEELRREKEELAEEEQLREVLRRPPRPMPLSYVYRLYIFGLIDRERALELLRELGYVGRIAEEMLQLWELERETRYRRRIIRLCRLDPEYREKARELCARYGAA